MTSLLTKADVAERLGVAETWVSEQVRLGRLPHTRVGRRVRFTEANYDEIVATCQRPAQSGYQQMTGITARSARRTS